MKKAAVLLILIFGIVPIATGQITLRVCEANGKTPFDCNDQVMVGTHLTIIISSDSNDDIWGGGLFIERDDRALGTLAGRDYDPNRLLFDPNRSDLFLLEGIKSYVRDWTGSHYPGAGDLARVTTWKDSYIWGFDLYTTEDVSDSNFAAGDWFIIDYYADEVGECDVGFYSYGDCSSKNSTIWNVPKYFLSFTNTPTRDLNSDGVVNFSDFAIFALQWVAVGCNDPDWCDGADIDRNGDVNLSDLGLFVKYWLWGASYSDPNDPIEPNEPYDPNVTYSIVDINGSNEITMDVNESITLYVRMVTTGQNNIRTFHIEANISDANLGFIDNTPIDSTDPLPTAQILAGPNRLEWVDDWGPGIEQEEGIQFFGSTLDSPISDGYLASFVFTCKGEGDVTLELINWESYNTDAENVYPELESILIHQNGP